MSQIWSLQDGRKYFGKNGLESDPKLLSSRFPESVRALGTSRCRADRMEMDSGTVIAGFVISTIGFSVFLYGKKQMRPVQLVTGVLMMVLPMVVLDPLWMSLCSILLLIGMRCALEYEARA